MTGILQGLIGSMGGRVTKGVQAYLDPGTYTFTVPTGVSSLNIMGIGAGGGGTRRNTAPRGGGGGGGSLITCNGVSVSGGNTIWVSVGAGGAGGNGASGTAGGATEVRYTNSGGTLIFTAGGGAGATFNSSAAASGGTRTTNAQGTYNGGDGGAGGSGNNGTSGGGGAGGYTGAGGAGGSGTTTQTTGSSGSGGGGGGAGAAGNTNNYQAGGGGGTGAFGSGSSGSGGSLISTNSSTNPGGGGSDGSKGYSVGTGTGGFWGGGGGGSSLGSGSAAAGKGGACVITWGPTSMQWPTPAFPASLDNYDVYSTGMLSSSASYRLNANGSVEQGLEGSYSSIGTWLVDGVNSDYEARVDVVSGNLSSGTTGTWLALSSTRTWTNTASGQYVGTSGYVIVQIRRAAAPNSVVAAAFVGIDAYSEGTL